jgi:hypothetical protein
MNEVNEQENYVIWTHIGACKCQAHEKENVWLDDLPELCNPSCKARWRLSVIWKTTESFLSTESPEVVEEVEKCHVYLNCT